MASELLPVLIFAMLIAFMAGMLASALYHNSRYQQLRRVHDRLEDELELERRMIAERDTAMQAMSATMKDSFTSMASTALRSNNEQFLQLARENLGKFQAEADNQLEKREQAVENMVKPIREALEKNEQQVHRIEAERKEAQGAITQQLQAIAESHRMLQSETRNLVQALRRPEVRGRWGEMTLKRLAELAGMVDHCDFIEQESVDSDTGRLRPDMVIRLPDRRDIVVDAKTPLDAYLSAIEATEDDTRKAQLQRHARNVRQRIRELAGKAYWDQFKDSPDFVVLFIPGEQFLAAALEIDHKLLEDALAEHVILATPSSFVALLRAVAYGWRQEALAKNAEIIREIGQELYTRLATFSEHMARLGRSLDSGIDTFNKAVGSFDTRILPSARKFVELGISAKKEVAELNPVERATRQIEAPEDTGKAH
ncbi:MAG: DNA recombination protein RmuC [Pseudomonadota bacterium]